MGFTDGFCVVWIFGAAFFTLDSDAFSPSAFFSRLVLLRRVAALATFGADENVVTLEISFLASIDDPLQGSYQNQASATCTDCGGQTNLSDDDSPTESDPSTVLLAIPLPPTPVPALPWLGLMLLSLLLGGYGWHRAQGVARL